ncbi:hypothetical protein KL86PLE_40343 [uncultured Pleomorphomonas sp.]|uniref:Uncharacterized protein n=1 Tax=uncultured Pleomorphomonas sp. TaxID=442121 RepID=A0A212LGB5_9HYPH|nr:hypothetical protein KL86PLE_40343 [uncultured Pleomorphomonas sp.]
MRNKTNSKPMGLWKAPFPRVRIASVFPMKACETGQSHGSRLAPLRLDQLILSKYV